MTKNDEPEIKLFSPVREPNYDLIPLMLGMKKRNIKKVSSPERIDEKRLNEIVAYKYVSVPHTKIEEDEEADSTKKPTVDNAPVLWNAPKENKKHLPGIG